MDQAYFFNTVCPALGVVVSNVQLASPFKAVMQCRKKESLGPLNPIPLAVSFVNLIGWVLYSVAINDLLLLLSVSTGVVLNFLGCTTAISLLGVQHRLSEARRMERLITLGIGWWIFVAISALTYLTDFSDVQTMMGLTTSATSVLYLCSPLSTIRIIVQHQDASSLYLPMIVLNLMGTSLWFAYGLFGVNNLWLYIPQGLGIILSICQISVKLFYTKWTSETRTRKLTSVDIYELADNNGTCSLTNASGPDMDPEMQPEVHYTPANVKSVMGMTAGGHGLGGIGLPGLVDLNYTYDGMIPDSVTDNGMDLQHALEEMIPTAAAGVVAALTDVRDIISSAFLSTPEDAAPPPPPSRSAPPSPSVSSHSDNTELRLRSRHRVDSVSGEEVDESRIPFHGS